MGIILFDDPQIRKSLLPLTFTRPICDIRIGILTIREKWSHYFNQSVTCLTEEYLQKKFVPLAPEQDSLFIAANCCPDQTLFSEINSLRIGQALFFRNNIIAYKGSVVEHIEYKGEPVLINFTWDIFNYNGNQIKADFDLLTGARKSSGISDQHTIVYNPDRVFVGENVKIKAAIINAENGPVFIDDNVEIQEGAMIRGPVAIGRNSVINMGAKIRPDTTVGPSCKVGGEVSCSVFFGNSNKGHDGFMGNSVIGEWCNLGADTNTSNLKNNYSEVKVYNYRESDFIDSKRQFCGLVLGDFSKAGINTMFNTGTVAGVSVNIFGAGFTPKFIPSFTWGAIESNEIYDAEKAIADAEKVMMRRNKKMTPEEREILLKIFELELTHAR